MSDPAFYADSTPPPHVLYNKHQVESSRHPKSFLLASKTRWGEFPPKAHLLPPENKEANKYTPPPSPPPPYNEYTVGEHHPPKVFSWHLSTISQKPKVGLTATKSSVVATSKE